MLCVYYCSASCYYIHESVNAQQQRGGALKVSWPVGIAKLGGHTSTQGSAEKGSDPPT